MTYQSIPDLFLQSCARGGDRIALRHKVGGRWEGVSWRRFEETVRNVAKGLLALGLQKGDRAAILSNTRIEWVFADLGIICAGATTVPIYQSSLSADVRYYLEDSGSSVVFVEDEKQLLKVLEVRGSLPALQKIVLLSGHKPSDPTVLHFGELVELGRRQAEEPLERALEAAGGEDLASIVYTSGTTGPQKGAMLTHEGFLFVAEGIETIIRRGPADETLLYLPLAHIFARIVEFVCIRGTITIAFAESIDKLMDNLGEVRPTFMGSVPRIYEKVYARIQADMDEAGGARKRIFDWAVGVGRDVSRHIQKREPIPPVTQLQYRLARKLVLSKIKDRFGGRLDFFVSGGAPLGKEIAEFFHAAGILILEGYGLTETTAVTNVNRPDNYKFGTVGQPIAGVEQKIAPDGEILSRSKGIMRGYFNREEDTDEVIDGEGWFHTGDIGEYDDEGFLRITDRKKDIIVTAGGKNVSPQNIENHLKTNVFISQAMVYGDRRKYVTALITLNPDEVARFADQERIPYETVRDLYPHPAVNKRVADIIDEKNRNLASYETIKKFTIVPDDFSQEAGELTPTLKVKRKFVAQKYRHLIDAMYDERVID